MTLEFPSAAQLGLELTAEALTRAFSDYLVPVAPTPAVLLQMVRADSVDLNLSRVVVRAGKPVGAALVARRGWTSRLAGMALVPEARGQGLGRALLEQLLGDARERGDRAMLLEVIEQNPPAVALYAGCGFERVRRLVGFSRTAVAQPDPVDSIAQQREAHSRRDDDNARDDVATAKLKEVDVRAAAAKVTEFVGADWPWQLSGETIATLGPPHRAFTNGRAWIVIGSPAAAFVPIRALVSAETGPNRDGAAALLRSTLAKFPAVSEWRVAATWPEESAEVFVAAGFERARLSQWQMRRMLG